MKFLTDLTLWKKITLLTAVGLLFGVGIFSSLGMRAVNQSTETMLQDRLTTARLVADYVDESLGRALFELQRTAWSIEIDGARRNLQLRVEELEGTYSRLSIHTRSIFLLDESGNILWSSPQVGLESFDFSDYPSIGQAIRENQPTISGIVTSPISDAPVIFLASPAREGQEGSRGILAVTVDISQSSIGGFVQPIRLGNTGYVEIVDQNGMVVTRTDPGPKLAPFEKSDHSGRFAALISAGQPTRGVCHTCHEPEQKVERRDVLAFMPLSEARWGVVLRQSEEEALAPIQELRRSLLLFGAGLVIIALLLVVITTRDVGTRIRILTTASRRIAEGNLTSPVTPLGKDEVGVLARTLDDMRVKLNTSYSELEQKTKELSSLLSVAEILTSVFDLPSLLDAVVAKAVEVIPGADSGILLLQDFDHGSVTVQCAIGLDKEALAQEIASCDGVFSANSISGTEGEELGGKAGKVATGLLESGTLSPKAKSFIRADVFHRSRHIGSLIMISFRDARAFLESDQRLLQAIADYVAIAIERAQLSKEAGEVRALQEADRLRSQFISSVSHELRTPLTLIKGYSTSLLRQDTSWDEQTRREFLQIVDEKTDELRDLIDKLLQSAKLEAGALKLEKEPVLLPHIARKVVEDTELRANKHKFSMEFTPSFPVVEADMRCVEQILRNLVQNAIKYSPDGGEITIAGEVNGDKIIVSVSDEGIGIPQEHQDRVFERFHRVENALTRGTPGSGLGLSITKGHVEAHGGEVWLKSVVGKGSKFYFSLPLDKEGKEEKSQG